MRDAPDIRYRVTSCEGFSSPRPDAGGVNINYERLREMDMAAGQKAVCGLLAALFPNAHILIVTRGFRSMILSSYSQYVRTGGNDALPDLIAQDHPVEIDPWDYDRLIAMYADAFGQDRVVVMPYELLREDVSRFTTALEERLGLDHIEPPRQRANPSLSPGELYWYPRLTRAVRRLRSQRLLELYVRAAYRNRLRIPIQILQRFTNAEPVTAAAIPPRVLERYRGRAESLRRDPLYAAYGTDYLW
jgi:hypothetical protein